MDNKTVADLHRSAESMGLSIVSRDLPRDICGLYDDRHRLILLADWLNQRQRRCTLCHELIHARHHDPGCGTRYGAKCERRCRRETALALISPVDYGMAEEVYEGTRDDGRGIGCHHPGVGGLPAAAVRFRRVRAVEKGPGVRMSASAGG